MMIRAHDPSITPTTLNTLIQPHITYILNGIIKSHNLLIGGVSGNPRKFRHSALWNFLGGWSAA